MGQLREEMIILLFLFLLFPLDSSDVGVNKGNEIEEEKCEQMEDHHHYHNLRIFATTFNANGAFPTNKEQFYFENWIKFDDSKLKCPPDIIIIGLQEMTPVKHFFESYVFDPICGWDREKKWTAHLEEYLGKMKPSYKLETSHRSNGIFLAIFGRNEMKIADHFSKNAVKTGLNIVFHVFGNKGGVGISFLLNGIKISIVNSHLAAGNKLAKRNQDYEEISKMIFDNGIGLLDHDLVLWMGDLNYRLETEMERKKILEIIEGNHLELLKNDQLRILREELKIFKEFEEMEINFKPTYKYEPNTEEEWNKKKPEIPAWCDRILYRNNAKEYIKFEPIIYNSSIKPMFSDHKPVIGEFLLKIAKRRTGK